MAQGKRSTQSRKPSSTRRKPSQATLTKQKKAQAAKLKYEIVVISILVMSIFVMMCVYFGLGGVFGAWLTKMMFGMFGISAYILPLFIFVGTLFKVFNPQNQRLNNKLIQSFLLIIVISAISHVKIIDASQIFKNLFSKSTFYPTLIYYFSLSAKNHYAGGFIGGLIGDIFAYILGRNGAMIIYVLIGISLLILITEQSFFEIVKWIGLKLKIFGAYLVRTFKEIIEARKAHVQAIAEQSNMDNGISNSTKKTGKSNKATKPDVAAHITGSEMLAASNKKGFNMYTVEDSKKDNELATEVGDVSLSHMPEEAANQPNEVQISFFKDKQKLKKENKPDEETILSIDQEIDETVVNKTMYEYPPIELLKENPFTEMRGSKESIRKNAQKLQETLESFGVGAQVVNVSCGPTVTRYEVQPDSGVKVNKIVNLADDIALNLAANGIRIEAPIPGKSYIGIEIPNKETSAVYIREVIESRAFQKFPSKIAFALGKDIAGDEIIADIAKMPHMLISGATGSGKSVCINSIITSILYRAHPDEVKMLMIDPKVVELKVYNGIPHLLIPVVTDPKKAAGALYWAVQEMSERYQLFAAANVRDLKSYNELIEETGEMTKLPQIVIIVDELADLMQVAAKDVEEAICRLAQMARAAGIHLILATQRPSVDVITGVIKANIPSRIAFSVSSGVDSRTIIDMNGAEKLVGRGDMLYMPMGLQKPIRVQGTFISEKEVESVVNFLKASRHAHYDKTIIEKIDKTDEKEKTSSDPNLDEFDEYFEQALEYVMEKQKASASMLQRRFRVGYNRAARIVDQLEDSGFIGKEQGSKPRDVLLTPEAYYQLKHETSNDGLEDDEVEYTEN